MFFVAWARATQTQSLVDDQLAAQTVDSGANGSGQDNEKWDQLWWSALQTAETLRDGMCWDWASQYCRIWVRESGR